MIRYVRLYLCFARFSLSRAMEFRLDFFFRTAMDVAWYCMHLFMLYVLFLHTPSIGGWDFDQMVIFASAFMLVDAFHMTFFAHNIWRLPEMVNAGDLDYYIVRPVSSLFFISLRDVAINSALNLIIAAGIMVWALIRYPGPLGMEAISLFLAFLLIGCFINYMYTTMILVPVFWLHSHAGLTTFYSALNGIGMRPDQIFSGWFRRVLVTVLPVALISSFPTHILFEGASVARTLHVGFVATTMFGLLLLAWRMGLRAYSSASS